METPNIDTSFVDLARNFSESFRSHQHPTTVSSNDGEWEIAYMKDEQYEHHIDITFCRVSHSRNHIEINMNMSQHESVTNHFMFYILIWAYIQKTQKNWSEIVKTDTMALQYYLTQSRPKKDVALGMINMLKGTNKEMSMNRYVKMAAVLGFKNEFTRASMDLKEDSHEGVTLLDEVPKDISDDTTIKSETPSEESESLHDFVSSEEKYESEGITDGKYMNGGSISDLGVSLPDHYYFFDTEFHEYSKKRGFRPATDTIELISIGIVSGQGREYYAVCKEFNLKAAWNNEWLRENVLKKIHKELCSKMNNHDKTHHWKVFEPFTMKSMKFLIRVHGKTKAQLREDILRFTLDPKEEILNDWNGGTVEYLNGLLKWDIEGEKPQFFAYFADYDWVNFCWIYGRMIDLPKSFPMYCLDLKQEMWREGLSTKWKQTVCPEPEDAHNALADAKWNRELAIKLEEFNMINKVNQPK